MVIKKISSLSLCFLLVFFSKASLSFVSWTTIVVLVLGVGAHREVKYNPKEHPQAAPALAFAETGLGYAARGARYLAKGGYATAQYLYEGADATARYFSNQQAAKGYNGNSDPLSEGYEAQALGPDADGFQMVHEKQTQPTNYWMDLARFSTPII